MPYTIEVEYTTGDSYNTYHETNDVGLVWYDEHLAIQALNSIKEQHQFYYQLDIISNRNERTKIIDHILTKDWIDKSKTKKENIDKWKYSISCQMDDGSYRHLRTNWLGYFEKLNSAKIVKLKDEKNENCSEYIPN